MKTIRTISLLVAPILLSGCVTNGTTVNAMVRFNDRLMAIEKQVGEIGDKVDEMERDMENISSPRHPPMHVPLIPAAPPITPEPPKSVDPEADSKEGYLERIIKARNSGKNLTKEQKELILLMLEYFEK